MKTNLLKNIRMIMEKTKHEYRKLWNPPQLE